jgi:TM2 domain-containing membrane protein YozV
MYLGEYRPGWLYMAAMVVFYSIISGLIFFRDSVSRLAAEVEIQPSAFILGAVASLVVGLALWLGNAVAAYYRTARLRTEPFLGVDNLIWPLFGSLLFPGWGQFLNGQPRKGFFFLLFGATGVFSAFVVTLSLYAWPLLKAAPVRHTYEILLISALLLTPVSVLMWLVSAYDSFRSGREQLRMKLSLRHAGYRVRSQWTLRGLVPRGTAILGLMLAMSLGMQFVPKNYYLDSLGELRIEMLNCKMEVMPELVGKVMELIDR